MSTCVCTCVQRVCICVSGVCVCYTCVSVLTPHTRGERSKGGTIDKGFVERRVKSGSCHQPALGSGGRPSVKSLVAPKYLLLEEERREGLTGGTGVGSGLKGP